MGASPDFFVPVKRSRESFTWHNHFSAEIGDPVEQQQILGILKYYRQ
ncbi:MAG: hypothetical protein V7L29_02880 [Nostoc sp.]